MSKKDLAGYRFRGHSLLLSERALVRNTRRTRLRTKAFDTLVLLLQNAPRPVTREQFASCVWGKTTVEDSNLTVQIGSLRKALGDAAGGSKYIETIPKVGYRFIPAVTTIINSCDAQTEAGRQSGRQERRRTSAIPISSGVPAPLVRLIGRDREVKELGGLLLRPSVRLVTLVGAGGSGKTELAQQTASRIAERFPGGAVFVSLAAITDPGLVGGAIAQSLGIRESGRQSLNDTVARSLRKKKVLLLLDNFEHVITAAGFVPWLLRMCPRLIILVTSRAPLRVSGEHVYPVEPLALPDPKKKPAVKSLVDCPSVALFIERATAANGEFRLTAQNGAAVVEICRTTGGLPLAIELAAAQSGLLSLDEMVARTEGRRLDLLTTGRRDAPERQQTMTRNIEWSYQLLGEEEKRLFARLSVFAGGFTQDAAEAVCGEAPGQTTEGIRSLLENQLISRDRLAKSGLEPRLTMLEVIREYAAGRLPASGEEEALRERHAEFFCELAEQAEAKLVGPDTIETMDLLEIELSNLRAAMQWSLASGNVDLVARTAASMRVFWTHRGSLEEGCHWLESALHNEGRLGRRTAGKTVLAAGRLLERRGDYEAAVALLERGLTICRETCDEEGEAYCLLVLGEACMERCDLDDATALLERGLAIARGRNSLFISACLLAALATVAHYKGNDERALSLDHEALTLHRRIGYKRSIAHDLNNIGFLMVLRGEHEVALENLTESLTLLKDCGDKILMAEVMESWAAARLAIARPRAAVILLAASDRLREEAGAPRPPNFKDEYQGMLDRARSAIGLSGFDKAWKAGRAMTIEVAIAYALKATEPSNVRPLRRGRKSASTQSGHATGV